jgi:hypothetical protein
MGSLAATLLGTMIFLWVLVLHTSRLAAQPGNPEDWRGIVQALAMSNCAFLLAGALAQRDSFPAPAPTPLTRWLSALAEAGAEFASPLLAISIMALGVEHFVFPNVDTPKVPLWIPQSEMANYLTGAALFAVGVGISVRQTTRLGALALALLLFLSLVFVHLPVVLTSPLFESDWTKNLVLLGGVFFLAKTATGRVKQPASVSGVFTGAENLRRNNARVVPGKSASQR